MNPDSAISLTAVNLATDWNGRGLVCKATTFSFSTMKSIIRGSLKCFSTFSVISFSVRYSISDKSFFSSSKTLNGKWPRETSSTKQFTAYSPYISLAPFIGFLVYITAAQLFFPLLPKVI
ncbi:hypothetical protein TRFO_22157 [Tritrichomonas foetus]|uniref:Uncharacterized protein n=1 Tax=Tritrichomonas foetus TaxID=1144522 RepID=A0A1J4KD45_9EUKA|nr:hypothetical protein TRFO_22157 [Tritrichomonas foetus]|eukprot:OHT09139.1 hypothetical protein TRFO_22157 [Tritrichomonas foetus]